MNSGKSPTNRVTRRDALRMISMSVAAGALLNCDSPTANDPGNGGNNIPDDLVPGTAFHGKGAPGTLVTPTQRLAAFSAVETKLGSLFNEATGRASPVEMLKWLAGESAFQTIGYSSTQDVYAIFTDGRPMLIATDLRIGNDYVTPSAAPARPQVHYRQGRENGDMPTSGAITSYEAGIPSRQFRNLCIWDTFSSTGHWTTDVWARPNRTTIGDLQNGSFMMQQFGYDVIGGSDAFTNDTTLLNVPSLEFVQNDGVLYFATYGGIIDGGGISYQALMTGQPAYPGVTDELYADEFFQGLLTYYVGVVCLGCNGGARIPETRMAITPAFIRRYWSFGPYSLVFINAGGSAMGDLKQAILDVGASVYIGWSQPVSLEAASGAANDFFSLMLGLNENAGAPGGTISPRQRPYDWGAVVFHLWANTETASYLDPDFGLVRLEPTANENVPALFMALRPSMYWNFFDEVKSELHLAGGLFGVNRGTVKIGTGVTPMNLTYGSKADGKVTNATVLTAPVWESQQIVVEVPRTGQHSSGFIQVEVDGRWSNVAQLTRIFSPLLARQTHGGSLTITVLGNFSIRGDFRGVRIDPAQDPTFASLLTFTTPAAESATWQASGSYTYPDGDAVVHVAWSGSGDIVPMGGALFFGVFEIFNYRRAHFGASWLADGIVETITTTAGDGTVSVSTQTISSRIETRPPEPGTLQPTLLVFFAADYHGEVQSQQYVSPGASNYNQADISTYIEVGAFNAIYPPSDDLGGR